MNAGGVVGVSVLGVLALTLGYFVVRLRTLSRRVGSFLCERRTSGRWASGIGQYGTDGIRWYRTLSLSTRPAAQWPRSRLELVGRGRSTADGLIVVTCTTGADRFELVLSAAAYAGLASWLEGGPPRDVSV